MRAYYAKNTEYFATYRKSTQQERRVQNVEILRRKRAERYAEVDRLKSVPCADCSRVFPPYVMDFDHLGQFEKTSNVSSMVKKARWSLVLEEIAKCEVVCSCCHRLRTHKLRTQNSSRLSPKRILLRDLKARPCLDCGGNFHYCQMDFDHVRGDKVTEVSQATGLSHELLLLEVAKCDLVCANCHRVRTYSKGTKRLQMDESRMLWARKSKDNVQTNFCKEVRVAPRSLRPWHSLAGTMVDRELARRFSISPASVCGYRKKVGIPVFRSNVRLYDGN